MGSLFRQIVGLESHHYCFNPLGSVNQRLNYPCTFGVVLKSVRKPIHNIQKLCEAQLSAETHATDDWYAKHWPALHFNRQCGIVAVTTLIRAPDQTLQQPSTGCLSLSPLMH
jgi:hypothetical protein